MRVVIADDQALVRDGLVTICERIAGVDVVAVASDGEEGVRAVQQYAPDVVLMDLRMPRLDGIDATRRIHAYHPDTRVVVLTTYSDDESIDAALAAGALGYLTKDAGKADLERALRAAHAGQSLLDPVVHSRLIARLSARPPVAPVTDEGLTARETEILVLIAGGLSNGQIARELFISESTVKTHINRIFTKTGSRDRAQAVVYAHRHGLT